MNLSLLLALAQSAASCCHRYNLCQALVAAPFLVLGVTAPTYHASAQTIPIPDATLGAESSQVYSLDGVTYRLEGGATRGVSLFHSFLDFNVAENLQIYFESPAGIDNIFSRITGTTVSELFGVLGVDGKANLFLMNPNGFLFGPNFRLDVEGSFVVTTADAMEFSEDEYFDAKNTDLNLPILTVNPTALLYSPSTSMPTIEVEGSITVREGQDLSLLGGDVVISGGRVSAPGGDVSVGGLDTFGRIDIGSSSDRINFAFPDGLVRSNVILSNQAEIDVSSSGGGSISIYAQNLHLSDLSRLTAGIQPGATTGDSQAGNIEINVAEETVLDGAVALNRRTGIYNLVGSRGEGQAGNIIIRTGSLSIVNGAELNASASTQSRGNAGEIIIIARDAVEFEGGSGQGIGFASSRALSRVDSEATGQAGSISINSGSLLVANGALLSTTTFSQSDAGDITINARESVVFSGSGPDNFGGLYSQVTSGSTGHGRTINIDAQSISITNGSVLNFSIAGQGNGGQINLRASDFVLVDGVSPNGRVLSSLIAQTEGSGNAGHLTITTDNLIIDNGGQVSTATDRLNSTGNGGHVNIIASGSVVVRGESLIFRQLTPASEVVQGRHLSRLTTRTEGNGVAGDLLISARSLSIEEGAQVSSGNNKNGALGAAGDINIIATELVNISGASLSTEDGLSFLSRLTSRTLGIGRAGDLVINSRQLLIQDGAQVSSGTLGNSSGNAGNMSITASDEVRVQGGAAAGRDVSRLTSRTAGTGQAGNFSIDTKDLLVEMGGQISAGTFGFGSGGILSINATESIGLSGFFVQPDGEIIVSRIATRTQGIGSAGELIIDTQDLTLEDGSQISADTFFGDGRGGSLTVNASNSIVLSGVSPSGFRGGLLLRTFGEGSSGNLTVTSTNLTIENGAQIAANGQNLGDAGNIFITLEEALNAENGLITTSAQQSSGGQISIEADAIRLNNSDIRTEVNSGINRGGDITLTANSILAFGDSDILAFARDGQGGNITLNTRAFFGENYQPAPPGTDPLTLDGNDRVDINASGAVSGVVTLPDVSFIENSLTALPDTVVDTDQLIAGSCIARTDAGGSFIVSGRGGLPDRPSDTFTAPYSTGSVQPLPADGAAAVEDSSTAGWQPGDPIVEPEGLFQLPDGRLVISQRCATE
ncbi:MAG: filamentous hemagglutinin N-terminal domain-containing protein [Kaiparowitsia implicata GSE-PSE-MK54-09C]|nr:filamentous hemagglutinin N-terminal domain-containing protein [Kaiparowitsia implicata GSE-PSE-MK54-09C]